MKTCVAKLGQRATFFVKPNGSVTESVRPGYLWVEGERVVLGRPPEDFVIELDAQAIHRRAATLLGELGQLVNLVILINKTVAHGPQDSSMYGKLATVKAVRGFDP